MNLQSQKHQSYESIANIVYSIVITNYKYKNVLDLDK